MQGLYNYIFERVYNVPIENIDEAELNIIKEDIRSLRQSYRDDFCVTHYEKDRQRKAYMISYYPNYIFPVYDIIRKFILPNTNKEILNLSYFGAGPCPELVGTLMALKDLCNNYEIYLFDYEEKWKEEFKITKEIIENYFKGIKSRFNSINGCDISLNCNTCFEREEYCRNEIFKRIDICFMQNVLNHLKDDTDFISSLKDKFKAFKKGAFLVIIDLNYDTSINLMKKIAIDFTDYGQVVATNINKGYENSRNPIELPKIFKEKIFSGNNLMPKLNTRYYYLVLMRG